MHTAKYRCTVCQRVVALPPFFYWLMRLCATCHRVTPYNLQPRG